MAVTKDPLLGGVFQSAADCSQIVSVVGETKHVFISNRTDSKAGSGHFLDPYNAKGASDAASAVLLDTILRDATKCPANSNIHLIGDGFVTNGFQDLVPNTGFLPRVGWDFSGIGREVTTLKLNSLKDVVGSKYEGCIFGDLGGSTNTAGCKIHDIKLDCNGANLSAGTVGGTDYRINAVTLRGNNCTIENVHVIHGYGHTHEVFLLGVSTYSVSGVWQASYNALIKNCIVDQPAAGSDYGSCLDIFGEGTPWLSSGTIEGCYVNGWISSSTGAVGVGGRDLKVINNTIENCNSKFIYADTGITDGLLVKGNISRASSSFVDLNANLGTGAAIRNINVCDNFLYYTGSKSFFAAASAVGPGKAINMRIHGNTMVNTGTVTTYADKGRPIALSDCDNVDIYDNDWGAPNCYQPTNNILSSRNVNFL